MADQPRIVVVGAGSQAKVAIDILNRFYYVLGVLDDDRTKEGTHVAGVPVLGSIGWGVGSLPSDVAFFVAIGANSARVQVADKLRSASRTLINAVHPGAVVSAGALLGSNVLVCANAVIGVDTHLNDDCVVNTCASVDHESVVGVGAYLSPGVRTAGRVDVGREAFIGAGATLGPCVRIGEMAIVGAASLVLDDIPARVVAWGTPARPVRPVELPINWGRLMGGQR
jgi:sugar O-acyltransferase (sialic acid O-acetyltransferase NeuD family)